MSEELPICGICYRSIEVGETIIGIGVGVVVRATKGFTDKFLDYEDTIGDCTMPVCGRKCLQAAVNRMVPESTQEPT